MLAWDRRSRKASLFVGPAGHRDLPLWVWPVLGYCIVHRFPTSLSLSCTAMHQKGERKWLFIDGSVRACTGTRWRGVSQLATAAFRGPPPFPGNRHPAWMLPSDSLPPPPPWSSEVGAKDQSECTHWLLVYCYCVTFLRLQCLLWVGKDIT